MHYLLLLRHESWHSHACQQSTRSTAGYTHRSYCCCSRYVSRACCCGHYPLMRGMPRLVFSEAVQTGATRPHRDADRPLPGILLISRFTIYIVLVPAFTERSRYLRQRPQTNTRKTLQMHKNVNMVAMNG